MEPGARCFWLALVLILASQIQERPDPALKARRTTYTPKLRRPNEGYMPRADLYCNQQRRNACPDAALAIKKEEGVVDGVVSFDPESSSVWSNPIERAA
jgi:hypothetical protein